ncbi:hypothetical protein [Methylosinus sp. PW1]|uniref:hypothetical protein n=1 Tax=Methylosinus sp. PW1 TaxID=107636 RepID=UPI0012EB0D07|nr:hypothetical protein [Methylosinus sp. PW1]
MENFRALATQNLSERALATMARLPHDLFDRRAELGQRKNSGVLLLRGADSPRIEASPRGEQCRVDERRSERGSYAAHRFTHGAEEGGTGVFHQMPAVGNLKSAGSALLAASAKPPP